MDRYIIKSIKIARYIISPRFVIHSCCYGIQIRVEIISEICLDRYIIKSIKIARYIY